MRKFFACLLALIMACSMVVSACAETFTPNLDYSFRDSTVAVEDRINEIISLMTLQEKISYSSGGSAINRLGLNAPRGGSGEALHGVDDRNKATVFPAPIGMSQTWDKDLMYQFGETVAEESLANNGNAGRLAPVLDITRDPRAGRSYETMGEDAFLTGSYAIAITTGMNQRTEMDGVEYFRFIPILKHPLPYNTEINRLWTNIVMRPRAYNEYYMRTFKYAVSCGGAKSLMNTYQMVNGKPMSVSPIQHALLYEWTPDYEGTGHYEYKTVNDYGSGSSMFVHSQRYFPDTALGRAYGVTQGAKNGQMSWSFRSYGSAVGALYDGYVRGLITEEDLEENVRRALSINIRLGDFDQLGLVNPSIVPGGNTSADRTEVVASNREVAFQMSQEQIVLLKNDGILPLSGADTDDVVLMGPLADQMLNDHYTGARVYSVTILDALQNKLGAENVSFDRAIDTVAIKASNGKYLVAGENPIWRTAGQMLEGDTPILAIGEKDAVTMEDTELLFEIYDWGSTYYNIRTPLNGQYVQVTPFAIGRNNVASVTMVNNTSSQGEANKNTGETNYVNYQSFRIVGTDDGKVGLYNLIAGNGSNGGVGKAYDADDEDLNNGSYVMLSEEGTIVADLSTIGPYRNEIHYANADILDSKVDIDPTDDVVDNLREESKFEFVTVRSSEQAIDETIAAASEDAPIILVLGYEPHINSREAIDLYHTGLSDQQMGIIDHVTNDLKKDVILIIKTGNAMTINETVQNNPRVKAILEIGQTGQEEGAALVSVLFDDGYSVPATGFAPVYPDHNTGDVVTAFETYPGYLEDEEAGTISAASPAGRLTLTWYKELTDIIGATDDHGPASYAWPDYDEETNDNLSNMNGTINNGIMIYDIIKGERTYQYFNGEPLYPFGYGLTYTTFENTDVKVEKTGAGKFVVTGNVTNTGDATSDEVLEVYASFASAESRIDQANQRLIAFERIHDIAAGETVAFSFEVDALDTMGVYDVEAQKNIIEAGDYVIRVVPSSGVAATADNSAILVADEAFGAEAVAVRDLTEKKIASDYDDYSMISTQLDDIETISASVEYASDTAVQFRKNGAWIVFEDAAFTEAPKTLTALVGSDRDTVLNVYALKAGSDPKLLAASKPIASIVLGDTRAVEGLPTGMGIGPVGVNPGTPAGQEYADAYIDPEWIKVSADVELAAGTYDVYFQAETRGARLDWFKFGAAVDTLEALDIDQLYKIDSIRVPAGEVALTAVTTPVTAMADVEWTVTALDGTATDLATIDAKGLVKATGVANGKVLVTAKAADFEATKEIMITNQLAENKVMINDVAKTVEYPIILINGSTTANDFIAKYQASIQLIVCFSELFEEANNNYYNPGTFARIPGDQIDWVVTDLEGNATDLATIDENGLLTATGIANGEVKVTATVKANADLVATLDVLLQNQGTKDAFTMFQAENFDVAEGKAPSVGTTFGKGANEMGLAAKATISADVPVVKLIYKCFDFGAGADEFYLRIATTGTPVTLKLFADDAQIAVLENITTANNLTYETVNTAFAAVSGIHDLAIEISGGNANLNWFQFN